MHRKSEKGRRSCGSKNRPLKPFKLHDCLTGRTDDMGVRTEKVRRRECGTANDAVAQDGASVDHDPRPNRAGHLYIW